jgi:hypothetical protein
MKIGGVDPKTLPKEEILVLPRGDKTIVFRAVGVPDYDEFDALCPAPKPPGRLTKDGWESNEGDKDYKAILSTHNSKRLAWMVVNSLIPSEIEWDTVVPGKPSTWMNWQKDMKSAGLSQVECNRITNLVFQANCLDEEKLKRARESFLLGQQPVPSEFSGQSIAPETTQSGEPVPE